MSTHPDPADAFPDTAIAVIGAACHLPGAQNTAQFWENLRDGVESIHFFTDEELLAAGVPAAKLQDANYVKASPVLDQVGHFDPAFWGISPKDAAIMDPQHRHFLECALESLEDAGHDPQRFDGSIGVFGGCGANSYLMFNLLTNPELVDSVGMFLLQHTSNDKDLLTTFASYKLGLEGPSLGIQTACSTSLVAIHVAAQNLINGECDMALAGGSTVIVPHQGGYRFEPGEILSPDGHCRPFDAASEGTVFGSGAGMVVLRRLADALEDGDNIRAVLRGSAVNNDGARKAGFLAPSVDGQAHAIAEALAVAEVDADSLSYVETHGTGTPVGDPIEVAGLTQAFRETTQDSGFCGIGSCKSNIGHTDTAAGVASFLKVVESLRHEQLPPSLYFKNANPLLEIDRSPFYVNAELQAWPRGTTPRRAGVNSLGVGGTNGFAVLEEAPAQISAAPTRAVQMLPLSAKSRSALDTMCNRLADRLEGEARLNLADVAHTLQTGRRNMAFRRTVVCRSVEEAIALLRDPKPPQVRNGQCDENVGSRALAFLLPGGGAQYPQMAADLYRKEAIFRASMERGFDLLQQKYDLDLRTLLLEEGCVAIESALAKPSLQLPAIFLIEIALAELWMSWGFTPHALLGHSLGENSAACLAGVLSFEDALGLVVLRGRLFETLPAGGMLSVALSAEETELLLPHELVVGVHNTPSQCVVSGPPAALQQLRATLEARDIECRPIEIDCAAHSPMLDPVLQQFGDYLRSITLHAPTIPIVSNRTGTWLTEAQATDPEYWVEHLRHPVHFAEGVGLLLEDANHVLLEVGPGKALASLARQHPSFADGHTILSSLRHKDEKACDLDFLCGVLGQLWSAGLEGNWKAFHNGDSRLRVALPTYPFERQEYWIEAGERAAPQEAELAALEKLASVDDWFSQESWRGVARPHLQEELLATPQRWLLFLDRHGLGSALATRLRAAGQEVITVREGDTYYRFSNSEFALSPEAARHDYDLLINELNAEERLPDRIVHCWTITSEKDARPGSSMFHHNEERGFYSLFFLAQALGSIDQPPNMQLDVVSNQLQKVHADDQVFAEKALLLGPVRVIPREYFFLKTSSLDLDCCLNGKAVQPEEIELLLALLLNPEPETILASRGGQVFAPVAEALPLPAAEQSAPILTDTGAVLITGGLGGVGLAIAKHFAHSPQAKLVLLGRSAFPAESAWDSWLSAHTDRDPTSHGILQLRALQELGAEVLVAQADVSNMEDMRTTLEAARQRFGKISGVVHAAGILEDGVLQMRTSEAVERVFTPKVHGTVVLRDLLQQENLQFFVLCSSTSAALGPAGQVDYVAANAFLNAFAEAEASNSKMPITALNWGIWSDIGMARELATRMHGEAPIPGERQRLDSPWFFERIHVSSMERMWRMDLDASNCWLLDEHRLQNGLAVMPGAAYLELALTALQDWQGERSAILEDVQFLEPCEVPQDAPRELCLGLKRTATGFDFEARSRPRDGQEAWRLHAKGRIAKEAPAKAKAVDLGALQQRAQGSFVEVQEGSLPDPQDRYLIFGPRFKTHKSLGFDGLTACARLQLDERFASDFEHHKMHAALLDIGTGCAMDLIPDYDPDETMFVPLRYGRLEYHAPLTAEIYAQTTLRPGGKAHEIASFDVELCSAGGQVLVSVRDFQLRRLQHSNRFATATAQAASTSRNTDSPAERAFLEALQAGIDESSGMEALDRVIANPTPAVLTVSSMDMAQLQAKQSDAMAHMEDTPNVTFQRPNLSSDFVEPEGAVEQQLAAWWQELLGIEQVGVLDDFFEVGGHSLVAVRLFARIKKKWDLDYPLSVLFEAPTIRLCADILRAEMTTAEEGETSGSASSGATRSPYLVPLNVVPNSPKTPFFLVAGMFGNVLNLRHLCAHLGADQPVYAIQARGLHGDDRPHRRFEDMARDYLVEIRKLQPNGPYLLGGFSGGGLTAFEMAQQLDAIGEKTETLILLDTPITKPPVANAWERILIQGMKLRRGGVGYVAEWPKKRIAWEFEKRRRNQSAQEKDLAPAEFRSELIREGFVEALNTYEIRPYPGRLTIFRPPPDRTFVLPGGRLADQYREIQDKNNHWDPFTPGGIDCFEVPGDHDSMVLEPHVRVLGAKVCQVLQKAQDHLMQQSE